MTKEETKRRFQSWCQREIGNNCSKEDYAMFNNIIALLEQQSSDDCVSRAKVLQMIEDIQNAGGFIGYNTYSEAFDRVDAMPPATPTPGTCKNCKHCCFITGTKNRVCEKHGCMQVSNNWYCKDFEKRGSEKE